MTSANEILRILDSCCDAYTFPMLDNGYVYLAATRLSLFRSPSDWAMVIELFGFSPRAGLPGLHVHTFASTLTDRDPPERYASADAFKNYLHNNPHNESRFFYPLEEGDWQDPDEGELVSMRSDAEFVLRGNTQRLPPRAEYPAHGIELSDPDRVHVYEFARYLAAVARDAVLATSKERTISVAADMRQLLVLDDWVHPDLVNDERPSTLVSFQQLARVLETGDVDGYNPTRPGNTHWVRWPDGGAL